MGLLKILIGILVFGIIVLIHEAGHFIAARACGITVLEFSLGLGPKLFSYQGKHTKYCLKAIPFGGSCLMKGEYNSEEDTGSDSDAFYAQSPWKRAIVIIAGPVSNFVLAFIAALILVGNTGIDKPIIDEVMDGYPAYEAGVKSGDIITSINDRDICVYRDITLYVSMHSSENLEIEYKRDGELYYTYIQPKYDDESGRYLLGIIYHGEYEKASNIIELIEYSFYELRLNILSFFDSIRYMLSGRAQINDFMGPVGMVSVVGDSVETSMQYGFSTLLLTILNFLVLFSANIGMMNLLPIPALDGGRLLFCIIEIIIKKPIPKKLENYINAACFLLLMVFMSVIMVNDVIRLVK